MAQVLAKQELPAGSPEEVEIRACTIVAVERLKHALAALLPAGMLLICTWLQYHPYVVGRCETPEYRLPGELACWPASCCTATGGVKLMLADATHLAVK